MHSSAPLVFALALSLGACGGPPADTSYAGTARYRYQQGVEALDDNDYIGAVKHFTFVKNKFPYSQYAALSELGIADSFFEQDKYLQAVDAYRTFVQSRPNHRRVPYALWRVGVAYFEQMPSDFFLFPPSYEKDHAATRDALRALEKFVKRFPEDEKVEDARRRIRVCRGELADFELYVARFYVRQERPRSAQGRLERVVNDYPDLTDRWTEAAYLLVEVYLDLKMPAEALTTAKLLVEKQPASDEAQEARTFLRSIGKL